MSERYIKITKKGKGKIIKEQNKRIKELLSKSSLHNLINKSIAHALFHIFSENDKEKESKERD